MLTTGIAALLAWSLQDRTRELVWIESTLKYVSPEVPESYASAQLTRQANGPIPAPVYPNGSELFRKEHAKGWNAYRYHFYKDYDLANDKFVLMMELEEIDILNDGVDSAKALAYANGYNDCRGDINQLLLNQPEDELRRKLARKKASSLPILLIAICCLLTFFFLIIPNRRHAQMVS